MMDFLKRIGTVLVVMALVVALLFLSTAFLPRSLVLFYIFGCLLALISVNVRQTRLKDSMASDAVTVLDGIALFLFVMVGFRTFVSSNLVGTGLTLIGIGVVLYSTSI